MQDLSNTGKQMENKSEDIRLVVFGYRQYNIVFCQGLYYGWPWSAGEFALEVYISGTVPASVAGKSIIDVKNLIDEKLGSPTPEEENTHDWIAEQKIEAITVDDKPEKEFVNVRLVVSGYRQYNILYCNGLYFGWPCSAGEFTWEKYISKTVLAAVIGKSIISIKTLIDIKLGPPAVAEENRHDWTALQQIEDKNEAETGCKHEEKVVARHPKDKRFLLIKPWGFGFWSDMHDVWAKLLLAEITDRHPVVFWGKDSHYSVGDNFNSFEQYFLPVSDYSVDDIVSDKYTYHPHIWNRFNVFQTDPNKMSRTYRDVPDFINCDANVLVSDTYNYPHEYMPWVREDHPAYGLDDDEAYLYIHNKYIKLQPDIAKEIDDFYHTYMETGPILAVHVRGGSKLYEGSHYTAVNAQTPLEIDCYLNANPSARIFLLTDDESLLEQYKQIYGNILIYTDCTRKTLCDFELCLKDFPDQRRKGIEIIKDSYLACKCDSFIGNWGSGVSLAISRLKAWDKDKIKLLWLPMPSGT